MLTPTTVAQAAPQPQGGTITDGIYYQTAETTYTGVGGTTGTGTPFKSVISISGNTINQAGTDGSQFDTWTMTYTITNGAIVTTGVCGQAPSGATLGYTATSTQLKIYSVRGPATQEIIFAKQN